MTEHVAVERFGKDHWSLLAYVETRCVDGKGGVGSLVPAHLRGNPATHPLLANYLPTGWKQSYSTRLKGFFQYPGRGDPARAIADGFMVDGHDDWDCLDDLEAAGYLEVLSLSNPAVQLTPLGIEVAAKLRKHKAQGGLFASFSLEAPHQLEGLQA